MQTSEGQNLALTQLNDICVNPSGSIDFEITKYPQSELDNLIIRLSMKSDHYEKKNGGFPFRNREAFEIVISPQFPGQIPYVSFVHKRFAGKPHVQWGSRICLYLSPDTEWNPRDGMYGLIDRLIDWLAAAAKNELDAEDAPLHPPVTYSMSEKTIVIRANTPKMDTKKFPWLGYAKFSKRNEICYNLIDWTESLDTGEESLHFAPAILFGTPLPMEFPEKLYDLIVASIEYGVSLNRLFQLLLELSLNCNRKHQFMVVGTPTKRIEHGGLVRHHIAVWEIEEKIIQTINEAFSNNIQLLQNKNLVENFFLSLKNVTIKWCAIQESRSEATIRRDQYTIANCLHGKRLLLLGCGAIGSHIAEHVTRAGPAQITLVDNKVVTEGSLVRQSYRGFHVGYNKSLALSQSLESLLIASAINVDGRDIIFYANSILNSKHYDMIIDATASRRVTHVLEIELQKIEYDPLFMSVSLSSNAEFGSLLVRMPKYSDGVYSLTRRSKIKAFWNQKFEKCAHSFWPSKGSTTSFQPEPGCSEPTFIASNVDVAWYASSFVNSALQLQSQLPIENAVSMFFDKTGSEFPPITILGSKKFTECNTKFQVGLYPEAENVIDASIETNRRLRIEEKETGGYLFGEIDESLNCVWIDFACGPSPDSFKSRECYQSGIEGLKKLSEFYRSKSGDTIEFIGFWHTHPVSPPIPSRKDMKTISRIFREKVVTHKRIVLLIVGMSATKPEIKLYMYHRDNFSNGELS